MMTLNLTGKEIGNALNYLLEAVLNEEVKNNKEDLIAYLNASNNKL